MGSSQAKQNNNLSAGAGIDVSDTDDVSFMSTAVPFSKHIQSLEDMNTQHSLPGNYSDDDSVLPDTGSMLEGGGDPKYVPYYRMERLWGRMGPREQAALQRSHVQDYF